MKIENKREISGRKGPKRVGGKGKWKYWGIMLAKLYCYIVCTYENVATNLTIM